MSSSLVMTTLLVGMSWPWVAALAMGEADMSGKRGIEEIFWGRTALGASPPSHHLPLLLCHCVWTVANPRVFISAHYSTPQAEEECGEADLMAETGKEHMRGHLNPKWYLHHIKILCQCTSSHGTGGKLQERGWGLFLCLCERKRREGGGVGWEKHVFEGWGGEWKASRSKITPAKIYNIANIANIASIQIQIGALKKNL